MLSVMLPNPEEPVSRRIRGIDEAVSRMTMLIDRFLSSERQEEGVLKIETVDIPALVSDIQQHFEHAALGKRLTFTGVVRLPGFQADVEMLKTVIVNLIDNALKAHHLYKRDVNYVVERGAVVIVDERLPPQGWVGVALVIGCLAIITLPAPRRLRRHTPAPPPPAT